MLSWSEEHCLPWPIELIHMPGELVVHEHSCTVGGGRDFQLHGCGRNRHARVLFQRKVYGVNFSRLKQCLFDIVLVPSLANHDFVLSGEQQHFLVPVQLFYEAHILPINPDTSVLFGTAVCNKPYLG